MFWASLLAGPACWIALYLVGTPTRQQPLIINVFVMSAIFYPLLEEMVFRGGIQGFLLNRPGFAKSLCGISIACLITSLLFAAAHLLRQPPLWAAAIFLPSLVFGWARERHKTLFSPIALHMSYNAGFIGIFYNG